MTGERDLQKLHNAFVVIAGLGAVGGFCAEMLARMGVGRFLVIDKDEIETTNIGRQIYALHSTIGRDKVEAARERIADIHPAARVDAVKTYLNPENIDVVFAEKPDVIVDAVDIVKTKIALILAAQKYGVPIVSSMGASLRRDISCIKTAPLKKTKNCPLAFILRKQLRRAEGDLNVSCVYSDELPFAVEKEDDSGNAKDYLGSLPYVTASFGLHLSRLAINEILKK